MIEARYAAAARPTGCDSRCSCRLPKLVGWGWAVSIFSTGALRHLVQIRPNVFAWSDPNV